MDLEARTFGLAFPDAWSVERLEQPVIVLGPHGEQVMVSAFFLEGPQSVGDVETLRAELEANALAAMKEAASDPRLVEVSPLARGETADGSPFFETDSRSADKRQSMLFSQRLDSSWRLLARASRSSVQHAPTPRSAYLCWGWRPSLPV